MRVPEELRQATPFGVEFRTISEAMPQLVWTTRPDGTVDYFNQRWIDYTGMDAAERARRGAYSGVVHPDDADDVLAAWEASLATGTPFEREYRLRRASDGSFRWYLCRAVPVRDDDGGIVRWVGTATDIDEQRRSRDSLGFMVQIGNVLSAALDEATIAKALARASVEYFADWCFVTLVRGENYETVAIDHKDAELVRYLEQFRDRYPPRPGDTLTRVIAENEAFLIERVLPEQIEQAARDPEHLRLLQMLQMHSVMVVPISTAEGRVFGALTMVSAESGRQFNPTDVRVAKAAARRAATAMANARALHAERQSAKTLRFTGRVNQLLFETADPWRGMQRVAALITREMADACAVLRLRDDAVRTEVIVHRDQKINSFVRELKGRRTLQVQPERELAEQLRQHRTLVYGEGATAHAVERTWPYLKAEVGALNASATVIVPCYNGTTTYGALVAHYSERPFDPQDVPVLEEIAARASLTFDRAETLERERRIATTLQQACLPTLIPTTSGLQFDAVYSPAGDEAEVGGDWYDAIELDDGSVVVSVGDVTGRGIQAAAIMSKVRHAMGMAPLHETDPTKILDSAGWFLGKRYPDAIVTAFVAIISPDRKTIRFANAGHPQPLLRRNGELIELQAVGLPLGLRHLASAEPSQVMQLQDGDVLVLFTDGLVEARRNLLTGEELLRDVLRTGLFAASVSPARLLARACLPEIVHDDVAILSVGVGRPPLWTFATEDARAAVDARGHFVEFLRTLPGTSAEFIARSEVVFGELLGNVVRHAPGPVEISLVEGRDGLVLHVIDSGSKCFASYRQLPEDILAELGRGLFIIGKLANGMQVENVPNCGNHVSVRL